MATPEQSLEQENDAVFQRRSQNIEVNDSELEEISLDDTESEETMVSSATSADGEKLKLIESAHDTTSPCIRPDNLAPHNYHRYDASTSSSPTSPVAKSPPATSAGGVKAIRSVSGWGQDTALRSKLPVQTQIKTITVLQLEKMGEFGMGLTGLPDGRL